MRIDVQTKFNAGDKAWCIIDGQIVRVVIAIAKYLFEMYLDDKSPVIKELYGVYPVDQPELRMDCMKWDKKLTTELFYSERQANEALLATKL